MSTKFKDEWGDFEIRVNDPRGQKWLYTESSRALNFGWNHENPGRGHIYLSEISIGGNDHNLPSEQLARSIARFFGFMVKPGGGYSSVQLHIDKELLFHKDDLSIIDEYLARFAMVREHSTTANQPIWVRSLSESASPSILH